MGKALIIGLCGGAILYFVLTGGDYVAKYLKEEVKQEQTEPCLKK